MRQREVQGAEQPAEAQRLLACVAAGDRTAFQDLYRLLSSPAYGLALRVIRDEHLAQDAVQEAFLQVWSEARRYDPDLSSARGWVLTLVHRRAVDRVRREQSQRRQLESAMGLPRDVGTDTVAEVVELHAENRRVRVAMARLTSLQQQALELAYFRGLTQTEAAAELQVPLGTVKTRIRDAVIKLRTELEVTP